jgi:hypothetical protein
MIHPLWPCSYLRRVAQIPLVMSCTPAILAIILCILNKLFYTVKIPFYYNLAEMVLNMIGILVFTYEYIADRHRYPLSV